MTIALDDSYGEQKQTYFIPVLAWGKLAEWANQWLFKGKKVALSGKLTTRTWDDKEGKKHYITEVVADSFDFADDKKRDSQANSPDTSPGNSQPPYAAVDDADVDNPWIQSPPPSSIQTPPTTQNKTDSSMPPWMQGKK
jgi:single-strand DNA-binding protein